MLNFEGISGLLLHDFKVYGFSKKKKKEELEIYTYHFYRELRMKDSIIRP